MDMSGAEIRITIDEKSWGDLEMTFSALGKGARFRRAMARAINRTARTGQKEGARKIQDKLGANIGAIKKYIIRRSRATSRHLQAMLTARNTSLALSYFRARQRKGGVSAAPWKKRRMYPGAFIRVVYGALRSPDHPGHRGVFWKKGPKRPRRRKIYAGKPVPAMVYPRLPLKEIKVPTWATVWRQVLQDEYFQAITRTFEKNVKAEINYELNVRTYRK